MLDRETKIKLWVWFLAILGGKFVLHRGRDDCPLHAWSTVVVRFSEGLLCTVKLVL